MKLWEVKLRIGGFLSPFRPNGKRTFSLWILWLHFFFFFLEGSRIVTIHFEISLKPLKLYVPEPSEGGKPRRFQLGKFRPSCGISGFPGDRAPLRTTWNRKIPQSDIYWASTMCQKREKAHIVENLHLGAAESEPWQSPPPAARPTRPFFLFSDIFKYWRVLYCKLQWGEHTTQELW